MSFLSLRSWNFLFLQLVLQASMLSSFFGKIFNVFVAANYLVVLSPFLIGSSLVSTAQVVIRHVFPVTERSYTSLPGRHTHSIRTTRLFLRLCHRVRREHSLLSLVLYISQRLLITVLWNLLKCTCTLGRWIEFLIQALTQDKGQIVDRSSEPARGRFKSKSSASLPQRRRQKTSMIQGDSINIGRIASPVTLKIRIPSTHLFTPPATPDTGSSVFRTIPSRSSATASDPVCDGVVAITNSQQPPASDVLASFDCSGDFMSNLVLDERIGDGAYGCIYRGTGKGGKLFAIKIMQRDDTLDQDTAFREEIDAMKRAIRSKWVAKLKYWQYSDEYLLLAMSFFPDGNIYDYAKSQKTVESDLAVFWTAEMLLALHSLHTLGIVHRDIKPENLMLSASGHIRIIDFGLAKFFDHGGVSRDQYPLFHSLKRMGGDLFPQIWALESNPHTTNEAFGTQGFAPPEVWQRKHYSYGVDYFAMACVFHELLTNKLPFRCDPETGSYDVMTIVVDPEHMLEGVQRDFLEKALMPNPVLRPSVSHMKKHDLFKDINWKTLAQSELDSPMTF